MNQRFAAARRNCGRFLLGLGAAAVCASAVAAEKGQVLFAFDEQALPFRHGLRMNLISYQSTADGGSKSNLVVPMGPPGAPDSKGLIYYGTVCEVNGELWMWYLGLGDHDDNRHYRICLAKSRDGRRWEKPALGAVDYAGTRSNNLVDLDGGRFSVAGCVVYHDPEDADAGRRFKMVFTGTKYPGLLFGVAYSPDGVHWTESPQNPRGGIKLEPQGGVKWQGAYYLNGQGGRHWTPDGTWLRTLVTHVSYDFEHWTLATSQGFRRDPIPPRPYVRTGGYDGEQVHLGAALWNRGNVIIGFYGQWHGHPTNDRRYVSIDTGLLVSHDALEFHEPIPDFRIVQARETPSWWRPDGTTAAFERAPAVMQGQGFANIGNETLFWYSVWVIPTAGIRVAHWQRDRLGYLQPFIGPKDTPHVISAPIATGGKPVTVSVNASGLSDLAALKVTVLNEQLQPIAGYGAAEMTGPLRAGFHERVSWGGKSAVTSAGPLRVRVDFSGVRPEDARLYAVYVEPVE
jgi:hypothetical protein